MYIILPGIYLRSNPALPRRYNYQRVKVEDPKILGAWFKQVNEAIQKYGIASSDICNFDKTLFAMGLIAAAKALTRSDMLPEYARPAVSG